jgi:arylsulfatase A-like enzyme
VAVDASLGRLLEAAGEPVRVVLTSDHGFRLTPGGEYPADHSAFGTLILAGDGVRRGETALTLAGLLADPVSVLDVLPTLLYWNGLPIADELEGEPLYRFFRRDYLRQHPAVRVDSYGNFAESREVEIPLPDASDEEYLERLKALGYIQ